MRLYQIIMTILLVMVVSSCKKIKEYFQPPSIEPVRSTIQTAIPVGYASNVAFSMINGAAVPNAKMVGGEVMQVIFIDAAFKQRCKFNPWRGTAITRLTAASVDENAFNFPSLGTTVFDFEQKCDGKTRVIAATGKFITSNGKKFQLNLAHY